jgi:hypothetical protein
MRFISAFSIILLLLASCSSTRVNVKGGSSSPTKWQIVKPI